MAAYLSSAVGFMAGQAAFTAFAVVLFCILAPLQRHVGIVRIEDIAVGGAISLLVGFLQLGFPSGDPPSPQKHRFLGSILRNLAIATQGICGRGGRWG